MASSSKNPTKANSQVNANDTTKPKEHIHQALIIGEPFDNYFDPITRETPKLLLPLVNNTVLHYLLDWLEKNQILDVILYCNYTSVEAVAEHCRAIKRSRYWKLLTINLKSSDDCHCVGDVLRDAYANLLITGDFVLIRGDTVGNLDLKTMLGIHKKNKDLDPACTATFLTTYAEPYAKVYPPQHHVDGDTTAWWSSRKLSSTCTMSNKIIHWKRPRRGDTTTIFKKHLVAHRKIVTHTHHPDTCIAICSPQVPSLFADNFDWKTMDNLVKAMLSEEIVSEGSVYQYVIRTGYATNLATWADYERVSMLIMERRLDPFCPEVSVKTRRFRYLNNMWGYRYYSAATKKSLPKGEDYKRVTFGDGLELGEECTITRTVLGNMCKVERGVSLCGVFAGDNCTIESGCRLTQCYLGSNVTVLKNTTLEAGCVVSAGVTVGPNTTVAKGTLVTSQAIYDALDDCDKTPQADSVVGVGLVAFPRLQYQDPANEETAVTGPQPLTPLVVSSTGQHLPVWGLVADDWHATQRPHRHTRHFRHGEDKVDGPGNDDDDDDEDDDDDDDLVGETRAVRWLEFQREVVDSLVNGIEDGYQVEKVTLEINASRFAYNIPLEGMQAIVMESVMRCHHQLSTATATEFDPQSDWPSWTSMKTGLLRYKSVLSRYLNNGRDYLAALQWIVARDRRVLTFAVNILHAFNQELEVVKDDVVLQWFEEDTDSNSDRAAFVDLKAKVAQFLKWLVDAEEESSEEEDQ